MSASRPVIGVAAALETASYGIWEKPCALVQTNYLEAVQRAGGLALLIPYDPRLVVDPDEVLDLIDGLLLTGGADIDPEQYGRERHPLTKDPVPNRDAIEIALASRAIERDMPVLGICRGMQIINVTCGGTLIQDIEELLGDCTHRRNSGTFDGNDHEVLLDPGTLAARAIGEHEHVVYSHHHQAVDKLGRGLIISGHSPCDQIPEAIEATDRDFVLGVQWHPEADRQSPVIAALIEQAGKSATAQAERAASNPRELREPRSPRAKHGSGGRERRTGAYSRVAGNSR